MEDQQTTVTAATPPPCTICGVPSRGLVYGAVACHACKTFFKRTSQYDLNVMRCSFNGHCEININTRHTCTYCRLTKCFDKGMQRELLRASRSKKEHTDDEVRIVSIIPKSAQIPTLNLLQADQSTLTVDQWNLLSNLSHCYDDHAGLSLGERYMSEQIHLPHRLRFKSASIMGLYQMTLDAAQSLYENNRDFFSLSTDDRLILLRNTLTHTASISANYILHQIQLMNEPAYFDAVEIIFPGNSVSIARRASQRLNFDVIVMKFFLAILSFSTIRCTSFGNDSQANLSNIQEMLRIQNSYIEITWRYLVYKHGHEQAVKAFSDFLRCIFVMNDGILEAYDLQWFTNKIDMITQKTEQIFTLDD